MNDAKRVFLAVNLPAEMRREIHAKLCAPIPGGKAKATEAENLHITLLFLGYLHPEKLVEVREKLKGLMACKKFEVELKGLGDFDGRVVWLGVTQGQEELKGLNAKLVAWLEVKDDRFHSHVTLARNKALPPAEVKELLAGLEKEGGSWVFPVESVDLMESTLSSSGPAYAVLFRQPLG